MLSTPQASSVVGQLSLVEIAIKLTLGLQSGEKTTLLNLVVIPLCDDRVEKTIYVFLKLARPSPEPLVVLCGPSLHW